MAKLRNLTINNKPISHIANPTNFKIGGVDYHFCRDEELANHSVISNTVNEQILANIKGYCDKVANGYYKRVEGSSEVVKSENLMSVEWVFGANISNIGAFNINTSGNYYGMPLDTMIKVKPNTTYTFIWSSTSNSAKSLLFASFNSSKTFIARNQYATNITTKYASFTTDSNTYYIYLYIYNSAKDFVNGSVSNVCLREGTNTTYTPYFEPRIINKGSILPSEYQQVEYIESSGTQYIDVGLTANQSTSVEMKVDIKNDTYNRFFGARRDYLVNSYVITKYQEHLDFYYGNSNYNYTGKISGLMTIKFGKDTYVDGTLIKSFSTQTFTTATNILLFAYYNEINSTRNYGSVKMYSCKITDNGVVVRDFIPCYRKSDNVVGLYDMVGKQFFTNAGSGAFVSGAIYQEGFGYDYYVDDVNIGTTALMANCYASTDGVRVDGRKKIDLGTLNWTLYNSSRSIYRATLPNFEYKGSASENPNFKSTKYVVVSTNASWVNGNISVDASTQSGAFKNCVFVCDTSGTPSGILEYETINTTTSLIPSKTYQSGNTQAYKMSYPYVSDISVSGNGYNDTTTINMPILADVVGNHYESKYAIVNAWELDVKITSGYFEFNDFGAYLNTDKSNNGEIWCNSYETDSQNHVASLVNDKTISTLNWKGGCLIYDSRFTDVAIFKAYLQANNVKIIYKLANKQVLDLSMPSTPTATHEVSVDVNGTDVEANIIVQVQR